MSDTWQRGRERVTSACPPVDGAGSKAPVCSLFIWVTRKGQNVTTAPGVRSRTPQPAGGQQEHPGGRFSRRALGRCRGLFCAPSRVVG